MKNCRNICNIELRINLIPDEFWYGFVSGFARNLRPFEQSVQQSKATNIQVVIWLSISLIAHIFFSLKSADSKNLNIFTFLIQGPRRQEPVNQWSWGRQNVWRKILSHECRHVFTVIYFFSNEFLLRFLLKNNSFTPVFLLMDTAVRGEMISDLDSARRRYTTASLFNAVTQINITRNVALQSFPVIVFICNFEYFKVYHYFIIYKCFFISL